MIQAILLAGGKGTRLAPLTDNLPKLLVPIHGKPMMQYVIEHLRDAGVTEIAVAVAHLGHMIVEEFGDGSALGVHLSYLVEPEPMGTAGWTKIVDWETLADDFFVINADNLFWVDVPALFDRHRTHGAIATIAGRELPSADILNYEILRTNNARDRLEMYLDRSKALEELVGKETGFVSSGWYVMNKSVRDLVDDVVPISNETHLWPRIATSGRVVGFYAATEPWFDSGTPERLERVADFIATLTKKA